MKTSPIEFSEAECKHILLDLGFSPHQVGYERLKCGILQFALDTQQSLAYEVYPLVAKTLNCTQAIAVEHSIRKTISYAWECGNRDTWEKYFPGCRCAPTNKRFIATIAEYIK